MHEFKLRTVTYNLSRCEEKFEILLFDAIKSTFLGTAEFVRTQRILKFVESILCALL